MFGYIRPVTPELKVKELDAFKACYCGLCHTLGREYGLASRFILNYDFVYLAMLLWGKDVPVEFEYKRCITCPHKKKRCCKTNSALGTAAGMSVILAWWKLKDEIEDEGFFKASVCRVLSLFLKRAYKKAAAKFPEFDKTVSNALNELSRLEKSNCNSMDAVADCFARILLAAAKSVDGDKGRILEQVFYHTGRWIYIVDACDDFADDVKSGRYNAVAARFSENNLLDDEMKQRLRTTLMHSRNLAGNSFELLDETVWGDTVRNIIALGMPAVADAVLSGVWNKKKPKHGNI